MRTAALTLALAACVLAQEAPAAPAGVAGIAVAGASASVDPAAAPAAAPAGAPVASDFLTGYFGTLNSIIANSSRPYGAPGLPIIPAAANVLLQGGGLILSAPVVLLKEYFNGLGQLFATAARGAPRSAAAAPGALPVISVGTAPGTPVVFPIYLIDPLAPLTGLYTALTRSNGNTSLAALPVADPAALGAQIYNNLPAPIQGGVLATDKLGRGAFGAFTSVLQGLGGAAISVVQGTGGAADSLLTGAAAAARDLNNGAVVGLSQALATLPKGSLVVPVTLAPAPAAAAAAEVPAAIVAPVAAA